MKYLGKLFATALVSLLAMGNVAQAQDMTFFRIGTGGAGGTYFPIGGLIANAIQALLVRARAKKVEPVVCQDWLQLQYQQTHQYSI